MIDNEWPEPTTEQPSEGELLGMLFSGCDARATDGCEPIEADGVCEHGYPSWPIFLGMI